ncbi:ABC transporter ATP-binding protein [Paenibacillus sp. MBLB4367]|uniref:ABC transporter ATP-binding protein n=1 Tax=Paenibacillus sp. MBLB4367 TaxID=3384767 RepID=UPI003907FD14
MLLFLFLFLDIGRSLFFAWLMMHLTDAAVLADAERLKLLLAAGAVFVAVSGSIIYADSYLKSMTVNKVRKRVSNDVYRHLLKQPVRFYSERHSGDLLSRLTNDIQLMEGAMGYGILTLVQMPLMAGMALVYLFMLNWQLAAVCLLLGPLAVGGGALMGRWLRLNGRSVQSQLGRMNSFVGDTIAGQLIVRTFALGRQFAGRYDHDTRQLYALERKEARASALYAAGSSTFGSAVFLSSLGIGAIFIAQGKLTVGTLMGFVMLIRQLVTPLSGLSGAWNGMQRSLAASERVFELLDAKPEVSELPQRVSPEPLAESIRYEQVSFGYDDASAESRPVLDGCSFEVPAGQTVALVGPSGAGKTTLFHLLLGLYEPQAGRITLDGKELAEIGRSELISRLAYVPQDTYLFSGSIRDNLLYGKPDAAEEELIAAARHANAHDFIVSLPEGYDTEVGERGSKLSGGQRQRLAIARALLWDAPVLLLDEATSALDGESEHLVQEALTRLAAGRTTLMIAHRLSTILSADRIVVLEAGRVVDQGRHLELLARCPLYARLYERQFRSEQLPEKTAAAAAG